MNDDDEEEPKWEGLAVKPSIGPRFGAAGAWNEAVANTYYARQADEDEVSKRVAEAGREAREAVLWREQCAKETAAIAESYPRPPRHVSFQANPADSRGGGRQARAQQGGDAAQGEAVRRRTR
jgi:hypothetical protein